MSCKRWEPLYSSFLDGEMAATDLQAFSQHLGSCSSARSAIDSLRRLSEVMAVSVEPEPGFIARFRSRRQEEMERNGPGTVWRWLAARLAPLGVAALLVAGGSGWVSGAREGGR